jgi:VWFA-related protein
LSAWVGVMSNGKRFVFLLLAPLLYTAVLPARQNASSTPASRIYLDVVVTAKSGPPVANLQQQDFTILDNKTPQPATSFQAFGGSQEPIEVVLVIDAVNTSYQNLSYQRGEIDKFLRANSGRLPQPTAVAFFTDTGTQIQRGFSTDGNALSTFLDQQVIGLRTIRRNSQWSASDRFQLSMKALGEIASHEAGSAGRKLIFWISPGWPLLSGPHIELTSKQQNQLFATIVGFSTQLRQARITLYSVDPLGAGEGLGRIFYYQDFLKGVGKAGQVVVGDLSLQVLATQSGGLALSSSNDVVSLLQKCLADTEAYYAISFDPAPADHRDEYHSLEIRLSKPGLTARTRQGYYAQP